MFAPIPEATERVGRDVIGAAIEVHRRLGSGFLERIYRDALCIELHARAIPFERERALVVRYKEFEIPGQRVDLIVGDAVIVELKASSRLDDLYDARVLSYLRTAGLRLGLMFNFNCVRMKDGIKRFVV